MNQKQDAGDTWRSASRDSILGDMPETVEAPGGSGRRGAPERRRRTDPGTTQGIRTFLIADVRGYTLFTQERGDEAAARLAARFAAIVQEHVERRDGSVIELRDDEALAVFRSPRQTIRAAVELQTRLLEETQADPDLPLPVGIGIDSGEAEELEGGYRGGALNLAGRLCSEAGPGEILASQSAVHLARTVEGVRYVDRGEFHLKGLSDPVHVLAIESDEIDVPAQMRTFRPRSTAPGVYGRRMQFRILGPLEVDAGSGPIELGAPKQRAVLAQLIVRANELVAAETLVDEIWGDQPPEKARNIIQNYLSHLRKAIGHDRIEWRAPGYRLRVDASELDAARVDALVKDARKAVAVDPNLAVGLFEDALALWRGPTLAGFADQPSLAAEATRLDDLRLEAQENRVEGLMALGAQARAIGELEVLVAQHPLRERLWGLLMLGLYREGRQADALGAYQRAREILAEELGIDPSPELVRLHERVLKQDPGLELRGERLRGYRLLEKISDGPRGLVFRAIQPRVERDVAVKVFHEAIATDPAFVRRFEQEAQAVAALEHPHVVPIYDYWREPSGAYIVARYLRGGSLRALEDRGQPLERDRAVHVVEHVASALAFAHRQGVTHGSLGSSNVLFDGEGNAYLGDFLVGIGRVPDPPSDVRDLARLASRLVGEDVPKLRELCERAELGTDVLEAGAFARAARAALEGTAIAQPRPRDDARNPYKGLRPFTEADARDFFGRGELTQRLVASLREVAPVPRFLAVVGPSGSGKSSVVRAGLVPAIRHGALGDPEGRFIAEMCPGSHPIDELEAALLRIAVHPAARLHDTLDAGSRGLLQAVDLLVPDEAEVVLVVDQFEEVFTLCADEREREQFLESLRVATVDPDSRLQVVVTLRADFYDRPLTYPRFGELLAATTEAVPPLTADELEQAIRRPAEQVGVAPEPGLVAEMIAEVAHQPGALPLLQYSLTELFERRDDDRLTLRAHQEVGGVTGALSARADRILAGSDLEGRRAIKQVFLRLVTLGEGTQDTRRRVVRSELDALEVKQEAIDGVLDDFGRHRFLTFDRDPSTREPTVEIAHEALLDAWGRLRGWIDETREDLHQERRLARAAAEWRASDRDPSFLLRGVRLEQVASWEATTDLAIGERERAYLKGSLDQRDKEQADEDERRRREARMERRSRTWLRALVAVFAVAALVAGGLTIVATNQSERASREARIARARELASAAVVNLDVDPELSVLLAMEAVDETRSVDGSVLPEAEEALHRAVTASRAVLTVSGLGGRLAWSPTGVFVTEGAEGTGIVDIRDAATGERVLAFEGHRGDVTDVAFSPEGSELATTGDDGLLKVWDPATGDLLASWAGEGTASGPSFSADGSTVAALWSRDTSVTARVLDLSSDRIIWTHNISQRNEIPAESADTALSPDGRRLAITTLHWNGTVFDLETGEQAFDLGRGPIVDPRARGVSWSPDGRYIATTSNDGYPRIWDAETGKLLFKLLGHSGFVASVAWSPSSPDRHPRLVTGALDGTAKVWDIGRRVRELLSLSARETRSGITGVAFSADGTRVMAGDAGITAVKIWDISPNGDAEWADFPTSRVWFSVVEFLPDGRRVVTNGGIHGALKVWDVVTRHNLRTIPTTEIGHIYSVDVSGDGSRIAAGGGKGEGKGELGVWNPETGEKLLDVAHEYDVNGVSFSPDGEHLVTAGWVGMAKVIDRAGRVTRVLDVEGGYDLYNARFSTDGKLVAISGVNGGPGVNQVTIWDWEQGTLVRSIGAEELVDFDPSGSRIVTVGHNGRPEIRDVDNGRRLAVLAGQSGDLNDVAFSPNGALVATAGKDGMVRLFKADTGAQHLVLPGHACEVDDLAFSPDGTKLASSSACDGVRIWALDIDDLLEIARQDVTRSLTDEECRQYLHVDRCPAIMSR